MEVPQDYILDKIEKTLDSKIEQLNIKIKDVHYDLKEDISKVYTDIQEFKKSCSTDMDNYDKRIRELEETKYKMYALTSTLALCSGLVVYLADRIWH